MRNVVIAAVLLLAVTGCVTRHEAQMQAQQAYLAGQNAALQRELAGKSKTVTIHGPVKYATVPWVSGLTLAQAIATAVYLPPNDPREITIIRNGQTAHLAADVLLNGTPVPLKPGDVVNIH